jgi:hypothetical protein
MSVCHRLVHYTLSATIRQLPWASPIGPSCSSLVRHERIVNLEKDAQV